MKRARGDDLVALGRLHLMGHEVDLYGEVLILLVGLEAKLHGLKLLYLVFAGRDFLFVAAHPLVHIFLAGLGRLEIGAHA